MALQLYIFGITFAFGFSVAGLIINNAIKNKPFYANLSNLNFVKSDRTNRYLGVLLFRKIIVNSFWKYLNQSLKVSDRPDNRKLIALRNEMTYAEVSHLIAFICVLIAAVIFEANRLYKGAFIPILVSNVIFHLYPPLLQQYNKRRIDRIIDRFAVRTAKSSAKL